MPEPIGGPLELFATMMGFQGGMGDPPPPPSVDFDPAISTGDVVPIAGDSYTGSDASDPPPGDGSDVVPIAGDSSDPAPPPAPQPAGDDGIYSAVDDAVGSIVDLDAPPSLFGASPDVVTGLVGWVKSAPKWLIPALLAIVIAIVVALVSLGGSSKSSTTSSTPATTTSATTSTSTTTTTATTTASVPAASPPAASVVSLGLSLGQVSGANLPLLISVQAAPNAPGVEKVTLAFTGAGMPGSYVVSVAPGKSVTHTFVGTGCGKWTVRIAAVNGTVVHAGNNPNLENGASHNC